MCLSACIIKYVANLMNKETFIYLYFIENHLEYMLIKQCFFILPYIYTQTC